MARIEGHEAALTRDVDAVLVPMGAPIVIPAGTRVRVTQALGGSVTVEVGGNLARIEGRDVDALGLDPAAIEASPPPADDAPPLEDAEAVEQAAWDALKTCYDPEIPVDLVNLGLIYRLRVVEQASASNGEQRDAGDAAGDRAQGRAPGWRIEVTMTLTAPGCPVAPMIVDDVRRKLLAIPGVREAEVELTFDPPWDRSRMSDEAKLKLGMF